MQENQFLQIKRIKYNAENYVKNSVEWTVSQLPRDVGRISIRLCCKSSTWSLGRQVRWCTFSLVITLYRRSSHNNPTIGYSSGTSDSRLSDIFTRLRKKPSLLFNGYNGLIFSGKFNKFKRHNFFIFIFSI